MSKPLTLFWPYSHQIMYFRSKLYAREILKKKFKNQSLFLKIYILTKTRTVNLILIICVKIRYNC